MKLNKKALFAVLCFWTVLGLALGYVYIISIVANHDHPILAFSMAMVPMFVLFSIAMYATYPE